MLLAFFPVFETRLVRPGIAICYDRHFEGVMSALAENGAELVLSPAVTFGAKSRRMWDLEFEVDAARHNLYIGGSNRRGVEPPWTQEYSGASYFAGPDGVVANVPSPTPESINRLSRPPPPSMRRPGAHRRSAVARMDCQTALLSLTLFSVFSSHIAACHRP